MLIERCCLDFNQLTSMLMERSPNFNPLKYSRDIYSSHLNKRKNYFYLNLIEKKILPQYICEGLNCCPPSISVLITKCTARLLDIVKAMPPWDYSI